MWRVRRWRFDYEGTLSSASSAPFQRTQAQNIRTEVDLLGAPANYQFSPGASGIIYDSGYTVGFVQGFSYTQLVTGTGGTTGQGVATFPVQQIGVAAWSCEDVYRFKYFWNEGIDELSPLLDYTQLSYFPSWFVQSFAGPTRIVKTGYLTWRFDYDRNVDDRTSAESTVFTVTMSPAEWWTYGGRYSAVTGAEL